MANGYFNERINMKETEAEKRGISGYDVGVSMTGIFAWNYAKAVGNGFTLHYGANLKSKSKRGESPAFDIAISTKEATEKLYFHARDELTKIIGQEFSEPIEFDDSTSFAKKSLVDKTE